MSNKYIHIIGNQIKESDKIHPFNNRDVNDLNNKSFFAKKFENDCKSVNGIKDISNGKNRLFEFSIKNEKYNIFLEHCDGGGRDISFSKTSKKVAIPYHLKSFKKMIKNHEHILVINLYFALNEDSTVNYNKYVYLIVSPSEIYSSQGAADIIFNRKKPSSSSRWVELNEILKCLQSKETLLNVRNSQTKGNNVWIVHPENLEDFLNSIIFDEYRNQMEEANSRLLSIVHPNVIDIKQDRMIKTCRQNIRKRLLEIFEKCQISTCEVRDKQCLVASHIYAVNEICKLQINTDKKINMISDINNVLLLCSLHDKLFDRHLISFNNDGTLLVSAIINKLEAYNLKLNFHYFNFNENMLVYIEKHRRKFVELENMRQKI